jgi:hypothetical protein
LVLLACLLIAVTLREPFRNAPPIRHDGAGYHAWTRAIVEGDFSFCIWQGEANLISYVDRARAMCQNKYPPGLALDVDTASLSGCTSGGGQANPAYRKAHGWSLNLFKFRCSRPHHQ